MTTKQLIELLENLPQDGIVFIDATNTTGDNCFCVLTEVTQGTMEVNDVYLIGDDNVRK